MDGIAQGRRRKNEGVSVGVCVFDGTEGRRGMDVGLIQGALHKTHVYMSVCLAWVTHGQEVMELLERGLRGMGVELIRIDGATPPHKR